MLLVLLFIISTVVVVAVIVGTVFAVVGRRQQVRQASLFKKINIMSLDTSLSSSAAAFLLISTLKNEVSFFP